jgi:predicted secreted protein
MATISGGEVRLFLSTDGTTYKAFAAETECSYEMNAETREVTSKDVAVFRTYVTSAKTWSVSGTMLLGDDDARSLPAYHSSSSRRRYSRKR